MNKFNVIALANTFGIIDLVLHPIFHLWVAWSPESYEWLMNLFVAGLRVEVTGFDTSVANIALGTIVEAGLFWLLGATVALLYNRLTK